MTQDEKVKEIIKRYEVVIKLVSNNAPCHVGHQIGNEWVFDYFTPAKRICGLAWAALYPTALLLLYDAKFPWLKGPGYATISCPDQQVQNIFELRRREKKQS
jgi:uncharacterized repeat protein (TIGR04076 family)